MVHIIRDETIEYIGILSKLKLDEGEKEQARKDLAVMLDYFDRLDDADTDDVEPMTHIHQVSNCFREDVVTNKDGQKQMLANAPEERNGAFAVPRTFG